MSDLFFIYKNNKIYHKRFNFFFILFFTFYRLLTIFFEFESFFYTQSVKKLRFEKKSILFPSTIQNNFIGKDHRYGLVI